MFILKVAAGVFVGLSLFLVIGFLWIRHKFNSFVKELGEKMAAGGTIPPFRIEGACGERWTDGTARRRGGDREDRRRLGG